jgi:TRAP-type uncharacterized transport system fused permease subunit
LPFFFVYNPVLVAQNFTWPQLLVALGGAALGVGVLAYALQGYILWVGPLANTAAGATVRVLLVVAGILLAAPEPITDLVGLLLAGGTYALLLVPTRVRKALVIPARQ